ncbi:hypothetical protein PR048_016182 [Dryococelus australis]|uniref:Uncharacterized protein n=1 Tax=Dryococelus australis TaxID=614101 RepID=A0ABQ9HJ09_9NEOP|nr:hypothetical protein PR048_016182 [Dryococelus australis]
MKYTHAYEEPSLMRNQVEVKRFGRLLTARSPKRVIEMSMEQCRNERAGGMGDPRENPPASDIVRHNSHMRKSGSGPVERTGVREKSVLGALGETRSEEGKGERRAVMGKHRRATASSNGHAGRLGQPVGMARRADPTCRRTRSKLGYLWEQLMHGVNGIGKIREFSDLLARLHSHVFARASDICSLSVAPESSQYYSIPGSVTLAIMGAAGAEWLDCLPPTKANRVQYPGGSLPDFRKWESCRTMPLVGGFSRGSPVSPAISFRRCTILTSITLIGSQDLHREKIE